MGNWTFPPAKQHLNISHDLIRLPCIMWLWPNLQLQKKESNPYLGDTSRGANYHPGYTGSGLFAEMNGTGMKMCLCEEREVTHCHWWFCKDINWTKQFLLANQMGFLGNSGTHHDETRLLVPGSNSRQIKHSLTFCRGRNLATGSVNGGYIAAIISVSSSRYCLCFDRYLHY